MKLSPLLLILFFVSTNTQGATVISTFLLDDFTTPYDTTGLFPPPVSPGLLEVTSFVQTRHVEDILLSGETAGSRRTTDLFIDSVRQLGDITAFITDTPTFTKPPRLSLNADPETAGVMVVDYDYSPIGDLDITVNNTHYVISLLSTDRRDVEIEVHFEDALGGASTRNVVADLGVDLTTAGDKAIPFADFGGTVDFTRLTRMRLTWTAGVAYDGELSLLAAGIVIEGIPEPSTTALFLLGGMVLGMRRHRSRS